MLLAITPDSFNGDSPMPATSGLHEQSAQLLLSAPAAALCGVAVHPTRPEQLLLLEQGGAQLLSWDLHARCGGCSATIDVCSARYSA